ncbi:Insulin-induced protein 2 protein [Allomyces javanicus]|nr:Insulin-induced protein 2 protein [Allomyces javanicus]
MAAALARHPRNDDDAHAPPLHDGPPAPRDLAHSRPPAKLADAARAVARTTADRPWLVPTSLFLLGYALSLLVVNLHTQHHVTHYDRLGSAASSARITGVPPPPPLPPPASGTILPRPPRFAHSWLPLVGAVSAVIVGIAYLIADACAGDLGRRPPSAAATAGLLSRRGSVSEAAGRFLVVSLSSTSLASLVAPTQRTDTCPLPPRWGSSSNSAAPSRTASSTGVRRGGGPRMVLLDDADVADPDDVDDELSGAADVAPGSIGPPAVGATAAAAEGDPPRTSATARLRYRSKRGLILRCLGGVVGINYAVSKVPAHPYLLSAALLALALAVFSMVDRTRRGFLVSLFVAAVGTLVCHSLTLAGYLAFVQPDLLGTIKAWVPVLIFTTAVGVGSAARVLLVVAARPVVPSARVGAVATPR